MFLGKPMTPDTPAFKIKNANLPLFVLHALTADMAQFKLQLDAHLAQAPDFFAAAPVALGLAVSIRTGLKEPMCSHTVAEPGPPL